MDPVSLAKGISVYGVPFLFALYILGTIWLFRTSGEKITELSNRLIEANKQLHILEKEYRKETEAKDLRHTEKIELLMTTHMKSLDANADNQQSIIKLLEEIRKRRAT